MGSKEIIACTSGTETDLIHAFVLTKNTFENGEHSNSQGFFFYFSFCAATQYICRLRGGETGWIMGDVNLFDHVDGVSCSLLNASLFLVERS